MKVFIIETPRHVHLFDTLIILTVSLQNSLPNEVPFTNQIEWKQTTYLLP